MKKEKAITLISLVITIVILIILVSLAIYLSLGNNGILTRANDAKEATNKQTATEIINLKITTAQMNNYAEKQKMPTLKELSEILKNDSEITYVTEKSQMASIKYEVGENPNSIFTKLNKYPYEFEINSSLQLASINGVKVADVKDKKEILWSSNESGTQDIKLEKNIKDYDFLLVYYTAANNIGNVVFDTSESYEMIADYTHGTNYLMATIKMDIDTNSILMTTNSNESGWGNSSYSYIRKVVGVKL